jgi:hypothetical protein
LRLGSGEPAPLLVALDLELRGRGLLFDWFKGNGAKLRAMMGA